MACDHGRFASPGVDCVGLQEWPDTVQINEIQSRNQWKWVHSQGSRYCPTACLAIPSDEVEPLLHSCDPKMLQKVLVEGVECMGYKAEDDIPTQGVSQYTIRSARSRAFALAGA